MKTNNLDKIVELVENNRGKILTFNGNGSFYAKIDRATKRYGNLPIHTKLYRDYERKGDGIYWLLQTGTVIKAEYSSKDSLERELFNKAITIVNGETYVIVDFTKAPETLEATKVKAHVNGDYSNACVFEEID